MYEKSHWSSGKLPSEKKQAKKKILGSDTEDKEEKDQEEEEDRKEIGISLICLLHVVVWCAAWPRGRPFRQYNYVRSLVL